MGVSVCDMCSRIRLVFVALISMAAAGCTYWLTPDVEQAPVGPVGVVVVGAIDTDDPDTQRFARGFRRELIARLQRSRAFEAVLSPAPRSLPENTVIVSGHFTEVIEGSEALRLMIGYGAGSPVVRASFQIRDPAGRVLAAFKETGRSFGGTGYSAHRDPLDMDDVVAEFARKTAQTIVRWSKGQGLESWFSMIGT